MAEFSPSQAPAQSTTVVVQKTTSSTTTSQKQAKAILLTCMDFRFLEEIMDFMKRQGYSKAYDHFVLAGSSLACAQEEFAEWSSLFKKHVGLAEKLHNIKEIVCIDHENCGAYNLHYGSIGPDEEVPLHKCNMDTFKKDMKELFPNLGVKGFFMYLDGKCEEI